MTQEHVNSLVYYKLRLKLYCNKYLPINSEFQKESKSTVKTSKYYPL